METFTFPSNVQEKLRVEGYCICDSFFSTEYAENFHQEIQLMLEKNLMKPNTTRFELEQGEVIDFDKPHIFEADLHKVFSSNNETVDFGDFPYFKQLFDQNLDLTTSLENISQSKLLNGSGNSSIKTQFNEGSGGCFPLHYDNPGRTNRRRLTLITYLNPSWKSGDGGELRLLPFLQPAVNIEPIFNRVVLFWSEIMLHRVLPSYKNRFCFSVWYDAENESETLDSTIGISAEILEICEENGMQWVLNPANTRVLSRGLYEEEYRQSLQECFKNSKTQDFQKLLSAHKKRINLLKQNAQISGCLEWLRIIMDD